jgi:hypothetical protein
LKVIGVFYPTISPKNFYSSALKGLFHHIVVCVPQRNNANIKKSGNGKDLSVTLYFKIFNPSAAF